MAWIGLAVIAILLGVGLRGESERGGWQPAAVLLLSVALIAMVTTFVAVSTPFLNVPVRGLFALPYFLLIAADSRFQPQPAARIDAVCAKYGLPERYVLYFGSNKPHRNLIVRGLRPACAGCDGVRHAGRVQQHGELAGTGIVR